MENLESDKFKWELYPFRVDSYKNWLVFGYPILGGWLPYIGFKSYIEYDEDHEYTVQYVYAEWFIRGYMFIYKIKEEALGDNG